MTQTMTRLKVQGFRSLEDVEVPLGRLTVLVGPNGAGKTSVLNVLRFLQTTVRFDLQSAVERWGGIQWLLRQGSPPAESFTVEVEGLITKHARATSLDRYTLAVGTEKDGALSRSETFEFKRYRGPGRKIRVEGTKVQITGDKLLTQRLASEQSTGLSTLPRLGDADGGEGIRLFADFLSTIRVFEPNVLSARNASKVVEAALADDASNLAATLLRLKEKSPESFESLQHDVRQMLPGLSSIHLQPIAGATQGVVVQLIEEGLSRPIDLFDASFGTVRALAILCALHDPDPPAMTAIEEVDHGLHPYALDVLVDRLRAASQRTQLLLTSHSPTLVNRLEPEELVICDRDPETGAAIIPAMTFEEMRAAKDDSGLGLGELWFGGALGGVPG